VKTKSIFLIVIILAILVFGSGAAFGVVIDRLVLIPARTSSSQSQAQAATGPDFQLIEEAWKLVHKNYVDRQAVDEKQLTYGAISGMVQALGDTGHSVFLSPEMVAQQHEYIKGTLDGIGAYVDMKDGAPVIVAPIDGTPAEKAGVHPGDIILKVNGESTIGLPLEQVVGKIKGPAGTQVTITLRDPATGEDRDLTITRAHIEIKNVTWEMLPGTTIAHVHIAGFSNNVTRDLRAALDEIRKQGGTKIILDLRNNPGGLLDESVGVASQFLASGNVLLEKDAAGKTEPVAVRSGGKATDLPMVVLVNEGTASASEIVAGALQDAGRATVIGETTFGTGTVLNQFNLSDGSALELATLEWLTPNGRVIWHQGIKPDVQVTMANNQAPLIPEGERGLTLDALQKSGDAQLLQALDLLLHSAAQ
jgi:carboxyl-terminal processing protease